jgi:hypothetical protein
VNKGIGCASCHGRVDEMPLMYMQNSLQMEWCLNCHRNPATELRPTAEIYNMAWAGASTAHPVWCGEAGQGGVTAPTAQSVSCTTKDPANGNPQIAMLQIGPGTGRGEPSAAHGSGTQLQPVPRTAEGMTVSNGSPMAGIPMPANYQKFTTQKDLGRYLTAQYHVRPPNELTSCETCHR